MLNYPNIQFYNDDIKDTVSGDYFPKSFNDFLAEQRQRDMSKSENEIASMLASIIK